MKKIYIILLAVLCVTAIACNDSISASPYSSAKAYFWINTEPGVEHYLYIDGVSKGIVPYLPDSLTTPGNNIVTGKGLFLQIPSGKYDIIVAYKDGIITSKGSLKIHISRGNKTLSSSWNNGKCKVQLIYE